MPSRPLDGAGQGRGDAEVLRVRHDVISGSRLSCLRLSRAAAGSPLPNPSPIKGGGLDICITHSSRGREPGADAAHPDQRGVEVEIADLAQQSAGLLRAQCALQQLLCGKRAIEGLAVAVG